MAKKPRIPNKFLPWIEARKKFSLSHKHVQMARELGLSPKKFGRYADRQNEPWKLPLSEFIVFLYERQFKKTEPEEVFTMEQLAAKHVANRAERKVEKAERREESPEKRPEENAEQNSQETEMSDTPS